MSSPSFRLMSMWGTSVSDDFTSAQKIWDLLFFSSHFQLTQTFTLDRLTHDLFLSMDKPNAPVDSSSAFSSYHSFFSFPPKKLASLSLSLSLGPTISHYNTSASIKSYIYEYWVTNNEKWTTNKREFFNSCKVKLRHKYLKYFRKCMEIRPCHLYVFWVAQEVQRCALGDKACLEKWDRPSTIKTEVSVQRVKKLVYARRWYTVRIITIQLDMKRDDV